MQRMKEGSEVEKKWRNPTETKIAYKKKSKLRFKIGVVRKIKKCSKIFYFADRHLIAENFGKK